MNELLELRSVPNPVLAQDHLPGRVRSIVTAFSDVLLRQPLLVVSHQVFRWTVLPPRALRLLLLHNPFTRVHNMQLLLLYPIIQLLVSVSSSHVRVMLFDLAQLLVVPRLAQRVLDDLFFGLLLERIPKWVVVGLFFLEFVHALSLGQALWLAGVRYNFVVGLHKYVCNAVASFSAQLELPVAGKAAIWLLLGSTPGAARRWVENYVVFGCHEELRLTDHFFF